METENYLEPEEVSFVEKLTTYFKVEKEKLFIKELVAKKVAETNFDRLTPSGNPFVNFFRNYLKIIIISGFAFLILAIVSFSILFTGGRKNTIYPNNPPAPSKIVNIPLRQPVAIQPEESKINHKEINSKMKIRRRHRVRTAIKGVPIPNMTRKNNTQY